MSQATLPEQLQGPPSLSWSQLNSWTHCGEQYRLKYIEHFPQRPQGALVAGIAGHETIRQAEKELWWQLEDPVEDHPMTWHFRGQLAEKVAEVGVDAVRWGGRKSKRWPNGEDYYWWWEIGPTLLTDKYAPLRRRESQEGVVVWGEGKGVEMSVSYLRPSGTLVKGYVDKVILVDQGEALIRDYKTGKTGGGDDVQLANYAVAILATLNITIERGQFVYLRAADAEKLIEEIDLRPLMPLVDRKFADLELARKVGLYPLREDKSFCKACAVKAGCLYGRTIPD